MILYSSFLISYSAVVAIGIKLFFQVEFHRGILFVELQIFTGAKNNEIYHASLYILGP